MNNAIGKWMSTTCCACLAKIASLRSSGCTAISLPNSLNNYFARHLGMNRAKVVILSRRSKRETELLIRIEGLRLEQLVVTGDRVRHVIAISPRYLRSGRDSDAGRLKREIINLHFRIRRWLIRRPCSPLCERSEAGQSQHHKTSRAHRDLRIPMLLHCFSSPLGNLQIHARLESTTASACLPRT